MNVDMPMPRNLEVEAAVIGRLLVEPERFAEVADVLSPSVMYRDAHRLILESAHAVRAAGLTPDMLTLKGELARRGVLERVGGLLYLSALTDGIPRGMNLQEHVRQLQDLSERRDVVHYLTRTAREVATNGATPDILGPLAEALRRIDDPSATTRLQFMAAKDVMAAAPPAEVVENFAWLGCITALIGASSAGKSFLLLSLSAAVGWGVRWHGRRVAHGSVAYIGFERDAIGVRLRALEQFHGRPLENFYFVHADAPLSPRIGRDGQESPAPGELAISHSLERLGAEIAQRGGAPLGLVVVDTARASMTGSEDSSEVVSAYLRALVRMMRSAPAAALVVAHHSGWTDGPDKRRRERGSSAWRGNVDATIFVEAGETDVATRETPITIEALKVRDDDRPAPLHLVRRVVQLGTYDAGGRPHSSCVVDSDRRSMQDRQAEKAAAVQAEHQAFDLRVLRAIFTQPEMATSIDNLRTHVGGRKAAVMEAVTRLVQRGWVTKAGRGRPYELTAAGQAALREFQP